MIKNRKYRLYLGLFTFADLVVVAIVEVVVLGNADISNKSTIVDIIWSNQ